MSCDSEIVPWEWDEHIERAASSNKIKDVDTSRI